MDNLEFVAVLDSPGCHPCCGVDHVGGNDNIFGECLSRAFGGGPFNSCLGHGEGQGAEPCRKWLGEQSHRSRVLGPG